MAETVTCPSCGASNTAPSGGAPFFCVGCKAIVDRGGKIHQAAGSKPPSRPLGDAPIGGTGPAYVSRYAGTAPREVNAPGARGAIGGSVILGLMLAAIAGVGAGAALGWLGANYLRVPVVFAFLAGYAVKRALAAGSGGGTPDRGPLVSLVLLAIVVASFGAMRYVEYLTVAGRRSEHYRAAYGVPPRVAVEDPAAVNARLRERDEDQDGIVALPEGGLVNVREEFDRLRTAKATGMSPRDGYDIELLASTGQRGFRGHLTQGVREGERLRFTRASAGYALPGFAVVVLWVLELAVLLLTAFGRTD